MAYHKVLGFDKEPFSTSPDPEFMHLTREHEVALTNILIELRLRRGLMVIFGDIGTGKTTLSRKLIQELRQRHDILFHMILNPSFETEEQFLSSVIRNFNIPHNVHSAAGAGEIMDLRDSVEKFLIHKTVYEKKTVVLIIDEAQKLNENILEALRLFLNFETNEYKLIQVVLLGQMELYPKVASMANFMDRISFKYTLHPLTFENTKAMIEFRMKKATDNPVPRVFLDEAIEEVYTVTGGYPRKINMLCHQILKELVVENQKIADRVFVKGVLDRQYGMRQSTGDEILQTSITNSGHSLIG
ncbi:MAG: AAA family ATPase [Candidatus Omnitrophica bacterium]|nr:AAA family ATPase [Candidatus Omnitrophota bacterium]